MGKARKPCSGCERSSRMRSHNALFAGPIAATSRRMRAMSRQRSDGEACDAPCARCDQDEDGRAAELRDCATGGRGRSRLGPPSQSQKGCSFGIQKRPRHPGRHHLWARTSRNAARHRTESAQIALNLEGPNLRFTSLAHHITRDRCWRVYQGKHSFESA